MADRRHPFALAAAGLILTCGPVKAEEISGIETDRLLADLTAGTDVAVADIQAITSVDIQTLTLAQLSALLAVLEALRSADVDVAAPLATVVDRIAFLEAVAEDLPIPASPI